MIGLTSVQIYDWMRVAKKKFCFQGFLYNTLSLFESYFCRVMSCKLGLKTLLLSIYAIIFLFKHFFRRNFMLYIYLYTRKRILITYVCMYMNGVKYFILKYV